MTPPQSFRPATPPLISRNPPCFTPSQQTLYFISHTTSPCHIPNFHHSAISKLPSTRFCFASPHRSHRSRGIFLFSGSFSYFIIQLFRNSHPPDFVTPLLIAATVVAVFRYSAALIFSSPLSLTSLTTSYFLSKMDQSAPPPCGSDMAETPTIATNGSGRNPCEASSDDNTLAPNPEIGRAHV